MFYLSLYIDRYVDPVDPADAKKALTDMNGFELAGRQIRVGLGSDKFAPESTATLLRNFNAQARNYKNAASVLAVAVPTRTDPVDPCVGY